MTDNGHRPVQVRIDQALGEGGWPDEREAGWKQELFEDYLAMIETVLARRINQMVRDGTLYSSDVGQAMDLAYELRDWRDLTAALARYEHLQRLATGEAPRRAPTLDETAAEVLGVALDRIVSTEPHRALQQAMWVVYRSDEGQETKVSLVQSYVTGEWVVTPSRAH